MHVSAVKTTQLFHKDLNSNIYYGWEAVHTYG